MMDDLFHLAKIVDNDRPRTKLPPSNHGCATCVSYLQANHFALENGFVCQQTIGYSCESQYKILPNTNTVVDQTAL